MASNLIDGYIVKYWDSTGIYRAKVEIERNYCRVVSGPDTSGYWYTIGKEAALSEEAAEALVRILAAEKVSELKKRISAIENKARNTKGLWVNGHRK